MFSESNNSLVAILEPDVVPGLPVDHCTKLLTPQLSCIFHTVIVKKTFNIVCLSSCAGGGPQ